MLSITNQGFASCPMEGLDECRVKRVLGLGRKTRVVMCLGVGREAEGGVYGPRIRFDEKLFVHEI
jgi:nitroreductase